MTAHLIDLPPDVGHHRPRPRRYGLAIAVVAVLALLFGLYLTMRASTSETDAETTAAEAVNLSELISAACRSGDIPPQYVAACQEAVVTRERVEQISGPRGATGDEGPMGPAGPMGPEGPQGDQGPQGVQGIQGIEGPQGDTGNEGTPGADGGTGDAGPEGSTGAMGPEGPQGLPGNDGTDGVDGSNGEPPLEWSTYYPDGSVEVCNREPDFNPALPRYVCSVTAPPPVVPEGEGG